MAGGPLCEVRRALAGDGLFAVEPIAAGACVLELPAEFDERAGRHTIQVDDRRHQSYTGEMDDFMNHSCRPTAVLDADNLRILAIRPITAGEEITLNYTASEWDMAEPFVCRCDGTAREIRGFRHLSPVEQADIAPLVPAWLWARRHRTV